MSSPSHGTQRPPRSNKRKRSQFAPGGSPHSRASVRYPSSINPFSHSPSTLRQLSVAGLQDTDPSPHQTVSGFPHRGLGPELAASDEQDAESTGERRNATRTDREKPKPDIPRGSHLDVLLGSVHTFLARGEIEKAARAYGLILQLRPNGSPIDVRNHQLWAIGAEILMRHGEDLASDSPSLPEEEHIGTSQAPLKRWGSAANMESVKSYYEALAQRHPYDYRQPRVVSALDFRLAMFGCEIYNVHAEHMIALHRLEQRCKWVEEMNCAGQDYDHEQLCLVRPFRSHENDLQATKDGIRLLALTSMYDISSRMDIVMRESPFSKDAALLRLRAMASLYVGDLVIPTLKMTTSQREEAKASQQSHREEARRWLQRIVNNGGELDQACLAILNSHDEDQDEEEDESRTPIHPSLPIREVWGERGKLHEFNTL